MRYFGILLVLSIVFGGCAAGPPVDTNHAADRAAAEDVVGAFFRAMESWDYDALRATVTPDFELVEDTIIMAMDDFVSFIKPSEAQGGQSRWTLTDFNTKSDANVAWTRYINRGVFNRGGQESRYRWIETAILTRQPGDTWKIDRLHSTVVSFERAMADGG